MIPDDAIRLIAPDRITTEAVALAYQALDGGQAA
jgi:hypothetical protein